MDETTKMIKKLGAAELVDLIISDELISLEVKKIVVNMYKEYKLTLNM